MGAISKHGHAKIKSSVYLSWRDMNSRCYNSKNRAYKNYGGRGITVCDRWRHSFENFLGDMGDKPSKGYTLERINNSSNYFPSNCKWATYKEQVKNKRNSIIITHNNKTLSLKEWSVLLDVHYNTLQWRIANKWDIDKVLSSNNYSYKF